jgi:hypothetical protein
MAPLEVALPPPNANAVAGLPPPAKQEAAPDRTQELQLQPAALTKATPPTLDPTMLAPVADKDPPTGAKDLTIQLPDSGADKLAAAPAKAPQAARAKRKGRGSRKSSDAKDAKKPMSLTGNGNKRARTSNKPAISNTQRGEAKSPTDPELVKQVRAYMKANKVSQVVAGQEARVSQAVISQWLSMKYHGHNDKVRLRALRPLVSTARSERLLTPWCACSVCGVRRSME